MTDWRHEPSAPPFLEPIAFLATAALCVTYELLADPFMLGAGPASLGLGVGPGLVRHFPLGRRVVRYAAGAIAAGAVGRAPAACMQDTQSGSY